MLALIESSEQGKACAHHLAIKMVRALPAPSLKSGSALKKRSFQIIIRSDHDIQVDKSEHGGPEVHPQMHGEAASPGNIIISFAALAKWKPCLGTCYIHSWAHWKPAQKRSTS